MPESKTRVCIPCADLHSEFLWPCVYLHAQPSPVWTAEGRLGEGGGIHQEEAAPGVAAVLLRPQCLAVQEESRYARTNARLHSGSGTELLLDLSTMSSLIMSAFKICKSRSY